MTAASDDVTRAYGVDVAGPPAPALYVLPNDDDVPPPVETPTTALSREATRARRTRAAEDAAQGVISAEELLALDIPELRWIVRQILPVGLAFVIAAPKIGKTWLLLAMSIAVASGGRALGSIPVERGDVLYLALEDNLRRLQDRLGTLLEDGAAAPRNLDLVTVWPRLDEGGGDRLREWLQAHPRARFVIVDTWARLRPSGARRRGDRQLYEEDYAHVALLKAIADEFDVAIVVVHHDRKADAEDVFDTISGTKGLTGAADSILVLKRARAKTDAVLHVTGRDVAEDKYGLTWSPASGSWTIDTELVDPDASDERNEVLSYLAGLDGPRTPTQLAVVLGRKAGTLKPLMRRMARDGQLVGGGREGYTVATQATGATATTDATHATGATDNPTSESRPLSLPATHATEQPSDGGWVASVVGDRDARAYDPEFANDDDEPEETTW